MSTFSSYILVNRQLAVSDHFFISCYKIWFQASIDQLLSAEAMDLVVDAFVNSDFCTTVGGDERCPEILEAVLRNGLPVLASAGNPEDFAEVSKLRNYQQFRS